MGRQQEFRQAIGGAQASAKAFFEDLVDDLSSLRTSITGITAQLDLDAGVDDEDYATNNDPPALKTVK